MKKQDVSPFTFHTSPLIKHMQHTNTVRLFCFPFAGGSFYAYRGLERCLGNGIRLTGIDLPGHGRRIKEPLLKDAHKMAEDIFTQITPYLSEPYAVYGHSLGAILSVLVVRQINRLRRKEEAPPAEPTTKECPYCLSTIPLKAMRCPRCTSQLEREA